MLILVSKLETVSNYIVVLSYNAGLKEKNVNEFAIPLFLSELNQKHTPGFVIKLQVTKKYAQKVIIINLPPPELNYSVW